MSANRRSGLWAAGIAAGSLLLAALPTAGLALGVLNSGTRVTAEKGFAALTPASVDPRMAEFVAKRTGGEARLIRFTPAGISERSTRSVTVAVRVNEDAARAMSVRTAIAAAKEQVSGESGVRITPTRFHLGLARDYQSFAKPEPTRLSATLSDAAIPDLADFRPRRAADEDESRFAARIALEDKAKTGATPRTIDSTDQSVDVAGSYRLTPNLDVTAGLRYSQDRGRLAPLAESAGQESRAVYVGTQFRF